MTTHTDALKNLYTRLKQVGIDKTYLRNVVLPSWWEDGIAKLPTGLLQLKMHLARHLGLDVNSVLDDNQPIKFTEIDNPCFKRNLTIEKQELLQIQTLVSQTARIARLATTAEYNLVLNNAAEIRQSILAQGTTVSLPSVLDFCWKVGIPVLHLSKFPKNLKKYVHGMVVNVQEKSVIILIKESKRYAWLLFILAHELGHIVKQHLTANQTLVDEEITQDNADRLEIEANTFAMELLTGKPTAIFDTNQRWLSGNELAQAAQKYGQVHQIDAGHIALNYGNTTRKFDIANKALNLLEPNTDAVAFIREKMIANLDLEQIPEDSAEFLFKISAISG